MTGALHELADRAGIMREYHALSGETVHASDHALRATLTALGIPADDDAAVAAGLSGLELPPPGEMKAPPDVRCYMPEWLAEGRCWGVACQLYALRSHRNWGIGDFEDLARFAEIVAAGGGDFVGINPLHALFMADPRAFSPFSPSSRRFLNPMYIAVDKVPGAATVLEMLEVPAALRDPALVDYAAIGPLKRRALHFLFRAFRDNADPADTDDFARYAAEGGRPLFLHALFEALSQAMVDRGGTATWHNWPEEYRHPASPAVSAFAGEHSEAVLFHSWLQWLAERQLADAQTRAKAAGMRIGLYLDLAVGVAPDGSDTWADRELTVPSIRIGAPPDYYNWNGQDWGIAPLSPSILRIRAFQPYRDAVDAVLRCAGALRIDHALGLYRLFWIASGMSAADGVYVRYPFTEMLRCLADVSTRRGSIVIGEDLGVVPPGFQDVMRAMEIQSYRVFFFEKRDGRFIAAADYPRAALACITTHDLHTLAGWWSTHDLTVRAEIGLLKPEDMVQALADRAGERQQVLSALADSGLLPDHLEAVRWGHVTPPEALPESVAVGLHRLVARTPSRLFAVALEDLTDDREQVNVPGTFREHPNWRRKMLCDIEQLPEQPFYRAITAALREERPR
jgi:4-alpha-glucanotransferase